VAVVGATGFIGSHLSERLVWDGVDVLAIARTSERMHNLASVSGRVSFVECDITDGPRVIDVLGHYRPDAVFHLACHPDARESYGQIERSLTINAMGVVNVLEACRRAGVRTFVLADSVKVHGNSGAPARCASAVDPLCSYAIGKVAAWHACRLYASMAGIHVTGLRPTFVYGPRQNWNLISYVVDCLEKGKPVRLQGGRQTRDPLYVSDAVEAFLRAATSGAADGFSIPIGGGCERTILSMSQLVCSAVGRSAPVEEGADPPRMTEIWRSYTDNADAVRLLGWSPRVPFEDGLRRLLAGRTPVAAAAAQAAAVVT
jgi:UDP-glucose 4-epimerase